MPIAQISIPLDLPDVQVLSTQWTADAIVISVESTLTSARCPRCGRALHRLHGHGEWVTVHHLPILGRAVRIRYQPRRYQCDDCEGKPTTTQPLAWHDPKSPNTRAFDDHLLLHLVNATVQDVSLKVGVPYDVVRGVVARRVATEVDWSEFTALGVLGLDEIALKKGHRNFVVIVTAQLAAGRVVILAVLKDRKKDTVKAFLASIPEPLRATIHTVCSDMYEGYLTAIQEELSHADLVIDRFHVAQKYRAAADHLRKQELRQLKATLSEAEYQPFHGCLWLFRKNREDLEPEDQGRLDRLLTYSPALERAYSLREDLTRIFEQSLTKAEAQEALRTWATRVRESGLKCFNDFLRTLDSWLDAITNYFLRRATSGFVEGLNNKLKVLKRRCYGLFNPTHLFQRIYLDLEGYRLFA